MVKVKQFLIVVYTVVKIKQFFMDVTKTGNGEWGMGNGMIPGNGKLKWEFEKKIKKIYFF